jgi:hypothetical protein
VSSPRETATDAKNPTAKTTADSPTRPRTLPL